MRWIFAVVAACTPAASAPCREHLGPGDLAITEVFTRFKGSGGDHGRQWFEIYNTTDRTLDLAGLELASAAGKHRISQLALAPHTFATLGDAPPNALANYLDYGYGDDLGALPEAGGTIALRCEATEIESVDYSDNKLGRSRELAGDPPTWCDASTVFEPENFGTPRVASDCLPVTQCRDGASVRAIVVPRAGDLAITEVMPSPTKVPDATGEWFEITARADCDLNGIALDRVADTRAPEVITSQDCMHVTAGTALVLARSTDSAMNGGLPAVTARFTFSLVADGDVRVLAGDTVIDAVQWSGARDGASRALDPGGTSWCDATTPYGAGDLGTPGAPNPVCP